MKVAIAGGTGLVGKKLSKLLLENGHEVIILTRGEQHKLKTTFITYNG